MKYFDRFVQNWLAPLMFLDCLYLLITQGTVMSGWSIFFALCLIYWGWAIYEDHLHRQSKKLWAVYRE